MSKQKVLQLGAEALIILDKNRIIKRRIKKSYRLTELDEKIRRQRSKAEVKLLEKASKTILVPEIIKVDEKKKEIIMDFLYGKKLSDHLNKFPLNKQKDICRIIGRNTAKLHNFDIIHGDLTTSNMIYVKSKIAGKKNNIKDSRLKNLFGADGRDKFKIYFIDFGLGFISHKTEDKAVDLHLLRQALEAKHFKNWEALFAEVLKGYSISKNHKVVLNQLEKVEKRGRYKSNY